MMPLEELLDRGDVLETVLGFNELLQSEVVCHIVLPECWGPASSCERRLQGKPGLFWFVGRMNCLFWFQINLRQSSQLRITDEAHQREHKQSQHSRNQVW